MPAKPAILANPARPLRRVLGLVALAFAPAGFAAAAPEPAPAAGYGHVYAARFSAQAPGGILPAGWGEYLISPGRMKTGYRLVGSERGSVLDAVADKSASGVYRELRLDPAKHPYVEWSWRVLEALPEADKRLASREDSPARLVLAFDGDESRIDFLERMRMRIAAAISGRRMPYATLMYVWSDRIENGTILPHPHTRRIKMIVVSGGDEGRIGEWKSLRRNVYEDFRAAFGESPGELQAVGVMTDADNTRAHAHAQYGDIRFAVTSSAGVPAARE